MTPVERVEVALRMDGAPDRPVGRLALVDRRILFEYDPRFLADPVPLSPAQLPPRAGVFEDGKRTFDGLFGLFDDSLPDGWGRLLLDRALDAGGLGRHRATPLDRLAFVGARGAGALVYRPAWPEGVRDARMDLATLAGEAEEVYDSDGVPADLLAVAGSSGGARPKVLVNLRPTDGAIEAGAAPTSGYVPALVKLRARYDAPDIGAVELAYARMAGDAGIPMTATWLVGGGAAHPGYFATRRFDREPRVHVHSVCGLLHADHRVPSLDYEGLLRAVRWLTRDQRAVDDAFRRAAFNVFAHNRDDHTRNFAFLLGPRGGWTLTPAYDLTFSSGPGGEHWMTVAGEGRRPTAEHLRTLAKKAGVTPRAVEQILDDVRGAVAKWDAIAREVGVGDANRRRIGQVLETITRGSRTT